MPGGKLTLLNPGLQSKQMRAKPKGTVKAPVKVAVVATKKKKSSTQQQMTLVFRGIGFPDQYFTRLTYVMQRQFPTNAYQQQIFQSSAFDPDLSNVGHQLRFFDQLAVLYNRYQVLSITAEITVINLSTTIPLLFASAWDDVNQGYGSVSDAGESKYGKMYSIPQAGSNNKITIRTTMTAKQIHGMKSVMNQDDQEALVTANPTDMYFLALCFQPIDQTTNITYWLNVKLIYNVRFFDLKDPGSS